METTFSNLVVFSAICVVSDNLRPYLDSHVRTLVTQLVTNVYELD